MKHKGMLAAVAALLFVSVACEKVDSPQLVDDGPEGNPYKSLNLTTKSAEYARQGNTFAFEFIDRINTAEKKDYIISPLSMQFLLGMLLDGAQGQTADEICKVLGYGAGETDAVNEYCQSMLEQLPTLDKRTKMSIANAIFVNNQYPILRGYKNSVEKYYQAEVSNLDFTKASALKTINNWCSRKTEGMIPEVLKEVNPYMLAYLLNALYFKSRWQVVFPKDNTGNESFTTGNGSVKQVPMMKNTAHFLYQETDEFRAVRLPYGNYAFCMTVFLPQEGKTLSDVTKALKTIDFQSFYRSMVECNVDLWLPKFETKYGIELKDILSAMGMPSAFDPDKANFISMSDYALCLSFVIQDAAIKVEEEGTEAAAVSVAGMRAAGAYLHPLDNIIFHADRPFLYLITETSTQTVLFAGRYGEESTSLVN